MRAFVSVILPDEVRAALAELQAGLRLGRPVPEDNLHLTLAFLDDQPEGVLADLHDGLSVLHAKAPKLRLSGLDLLGGLNPKLLFGSIDTNPVLKTLRERVLSEVRAAGINLKRERFRPHVTLVRFRYGMRFEDQEKLRRFIQEVGAFTLPPFVPVTFGLYGSTLRPDGAEHELLAEYPLYPPVQS